MGEERKGEGSSGQGGQGERKAERVLIPPLTLRSVTSTLRKTYLSTKKIKANAWEPSLNFTQSFLCFSDFLLCLE